MSASSVAHVMRVKRLYRQGLKNLLNWCVHRDLWIAEGNKLRARFEANRLAQGQVLIEKLVTEGEAELKKFTHPDPYKSGPRPQHPPPPK